MTSQMRHDNNEKHVASIGQCTATIQNCFIFSSLLPQLLYPLFQIDIYKKGAVGYNLQVQKGRASTKFDPVRSAPVKTNRSLTNHGRRSSK